MHKIIFYKDPRGKSPLLDYINELENKGDKDSRINLIKIRDYVKALEKTGHFDLIHTLNILKTIYGNLGQLAIGYYSRPLYVLLHVFKKETQKTPRREIEQAKREFTNFKERWTSYDRN